MKLVRNSNDLPESSRSADSLVRESCYRRSRGQGCPRSWSRAPSAAFTLIEVMIAAAMLFLCLFAILGLLANALRNARALQHHTLDAGMLAAELSLTNKLEEGSDSGDFGDVYSDYRWRREIYQVSSNGLFEADFSVFKGSGSSDPQSKLSVLFFRPDSPMRPGGGFPR